VPGDAELARFHRFGKKRVTDRRPAHDLGIESDLSAEKPTGLAMEPDSDGKMTPMMKQFYDIKLLHPDKILFYRMGDFYEMFGEDAVVAAKVLQIQLTTRNKNKKDATPLCGIPIHAYEQYLNRLTRAGYKVAVCEQTEDPAQAKGLVKREVVRIVTPGTIVAADLLEAGVNSFIAAVWRDGRGSQCGFACCDLSTGEFELDEVDTKTGWNGIQELIYLYRPREILLPQADNDGEPGFFADLIESLRQWGQNGSRSPHIEYLDPYRFDLRNTQRLLREHFSVASLAGFGVDGLPAGIRAAGALLTYLVETQQDRLYHITRLGRVPKDDRMILDESTVRNLELFENADNSGRKHTLAHLLDQCRTAMGSRKLRRWIAAPLKRRALIEARLDQVATLVAHPTIAAEVRKTLSAIADLERIIARIDMPSTNLQDLVRLRQSLKPLADLASVLLPLSETAVGALMKGFDTLPDIAELLETHLLPDPSRKIKEGGYIAAGVDAKLDELKALMKNGKQLIANMEAETRTETGISSLKIGYNRVFGYFIEVSNASKHLVPETFIRKQTLANAERFVTEDLKELEERILTAEDASAEIEREILEKIKARLQAATARIQASAQIVARIDVLTALAEIARERNYCRPVLDDHPGCRRIRILEGRHPVIESLDLEEPFISNDVTLDSSDRYILVITGPNMGGKSTYMRQTALIALLAHIGSFVPAATAELSVFDRIFTRVGASDNLTRGQSTFMVEMSEAASILNNATARSLIILDEIGRGTSTFDGIGLAWAIIEFIHRLEALTLFATHYHELIQLEERLKGVQNAKVVVREARQQLVFLRKVVAGQTDKSYGIEVARMAGLPAVLIARAEVVVRNLKRAEERIGHPEHQRSTEVDSAGSIGDSVQMSFLPSEPSWMQELRSFDLNHQTPVQAMAFLQQIQKRMG
jgi:DNA mismatch repair protein MutS